VIGVKMGAQDKVDVVHRQSRRPKALHPCVIVLLVPQRTCAVLVIADASIDEDGMVRGLHDV
jgi:hypothetical protein